MLQCSDFSDTCVVAERDGQLIGWVSGYRRPVVPAQLFIWQVAVAPDARGQGLAGRMLDGLLARAPLAGITHVLATITDDNRPSWGLFEALARRRRVPLQRSLRFERRIHFADAHASEWQVRIGPLPPCGAAPIPGDSRS